MLLYWSCYLWMCIPNGSCNVGTVPAQSPVYEREIPLSQQVAILPGLLLLENDVKGWAGEV